MAEPLKHAAAPQEPQDRPALSLVPPLPPETPRETQLRQHLEGSRYALVLKLAMLKAATIRAKGGASFKDWRNE